MTLLDSWETLVVSLSNNLMFDGIRGSILNEEIKRKASGEGSASANVTRGRTEKKSETVWQNRSKSKGKAEVTCYQCGGKGRKKPDCRYYKAELERKKNTGDKKKKDDENEAHNSFKDKDKENANVASSVIIEEPSDVEDILCANMTPSHAEVNDASVYIHGHDMQITKGDLIDALRTLNDALSQT